MSDCGKCGGLESELREERRLRTGLEQRFDHRISGCETVDKARILLSRRPTDSPVETELRDTLAELLIKCCCLEAELSRYRER